MHRYHSYFARFIDFGQKNSQVEDSWVSMHVTYCTGDVVLAICCGCIFSSKGACVRLHTKDCNYGSFTDPRQVNLDDWKVERPHSHDDAAQKCSVYHDFRKRVGPWILAGRIAPPLFDTPQLAADRLWCDNSGLSFWHCLVCATNGSDFIAMPQGRFLCTSFGCAKLVWSFIHSAYCCWVIKELMCNDLSRAVCDHLAYKVAQGAKRYHSTLRSRAESDQRAFCRAKNENHVA